MRGPIDPPPALWRGGRVLDGTGRPPYVADLRLAEGRIVAVGRELRREGEEVVDLRGQYVAPGFIDVHSHSDLTVLANPGLESKALQGVTTEVVGNCGSSPFPVAAGHLAELQSYVDSYYPGVSGRARWDWTDLPGWQRAVDSARPRLNLAPLVGHGSVRIAVAGFRNGRLDRPEADAAVALVGDALDAGAFGFSTGLAYPPEVDVTPEDLEPFVRVVSAHDAVYATHMRDEGTGVLAAVAESVDLARKARARLEISHLKALGRAQWGSGRGLLERVAAARAAGLEVRADMYPYSAGETGLFVVLPSWASNGAWPEVEARLNDPATRERIREETRRGIPRWTVAPGHLEWSDFRISAVADPGSARWEGQSLADVAAARGVSPVDAAMDLLLQNRGAVSVLVFGMDPQDVRLVLDDPEVLVGSDGIGNSLANGPLHGPIHPRNYGTFPRFLSDRQSTPEALALAVRRAAALPCEHFRIPERGCIAAGRIADLVTWNVGESDVGPDYGERPRYARVVRTVLVRGVPVVEDGRLTDAGPGEVLRRPRGAGRLSP